MDSLWAVVFGLLSITFHELGHYEAMRRCGVKIKEVGLLGLPISFLPSLYWKVRGMTWAIHPFLLGAYVEPVSEGEIKSKVLRDQLYIFGNGPIANFVYAMGLTSLAGIIAGLESGDSKKVWFASVVFGGGGLLMWMLRRHIALVLPALSIPIIILVGYVIFSLSPTQAIESGSGGPVAVVAGLMGAKDFLDALKLAMFLSLNLGLVNLLPVSLLDGGRMWEAIVKSWFGNRFANAYNWVTTPLLIALIVYFLGLDAVRVWGWF